jgi:hypothetical protein
MQARARLNRFGLSLAAALPSSQQTAVSFILGSMS